MTCQHCSTNIIVTTPEGDTHERKVCGNCNTILYENPKIVAGVLPIFEDKILLCKRNIEPRKHLDRSLRLYGT